MTCRIKHCRDSSAVTYLGYSVCDKHWNWHCDENKSFNLKKIFNIKRGDINE